MKIGILTFHNADNYGAVLQCYALQETLKTLYPDDEVRVVDYRNLAIERSYRILGLRRRPLGNVTQFLYAPALMRKHRQFGKFRTSFLDVGTARFDDYDVILFGSDQIWNAELTGSDLSYFGKGFFGTKIAYAASDGGEIGSTDDEIQGLLRGFSAVSCREKSLSKKICAMTGRGDIQIVCDPVFLRSKRQWQEFSQLPEERGYVLAYKISEHPQFDSEAEFLGRQLGKQVVQVVYVRSLKKMFCRRQKFIECLSPQQFVGLFDSADFVLTTSFHGTAFSLIFEKPFFVLAFDGRSERITDWLSRLGLQGRYGESARTLSQESLLLMEPTEKRLTEYREESMCFLKCILGKNAS